VVSRDVDFHIGGASRILVGGHLLRFMQRLYCFILKWLKEDVVLGGDPSMC
jgi:hypothetical protein